MKKIDPKSIPTPDFHQYLLGAVAPRPIAFVSTMDEHGNPNLAPYSFFNAFSSNPPILVFSSNRRVANNTTKDTLHNAEATGEVVVNVVSYNIVRQMAVASIEFAPEVNEFEKSGLTPLPSDLVRPFRVKESPVHMECKVRQILPLGDLGGAGHLIVCEILRMHIDEQVLDENGRIDPHRIDLMGRMGRMYYVRASGEAVHTIIQPTDPKCIGFSHLPESVLNSKILTGNNLGQLAGQSRLPLEAELDEIRETPRVQELLQEQNPQEALHRYAQVELDKDNRDLAIKLVVIADQLSSIAGSKG